MVESESASSWWNSDVSLDPFVQALHQLVLDRGYRSRICFARALGKNSGGGVSRWYRGERVPTPQDFGKILILLAPNNEELDAIVDPYAKLVEQGRGVPAERGITLRKPQAMTYNGADAGRELGLSRERIRQLRNKFGLPRRLTEEHIEMLRRRQ